MVNNILHVMDLKLKVEISDFAPCCTYDIINLLQSSATVFSGKNR
jgi:hypothetical protein